jgi:hypothetical protein
MHDAGTAAGLDESHLVIPANFVFDANAAVELDEIGTNAKQDVLAIVDNLGGAGMFIRRRAPSEIGTALENGDAKTGISEGAGCG